MNTKDRKRLRYLASHQLEIAQRDVYTVNKDMNKVRRYVEIIRETIDKYWEG